MSREESEQETPRWESREEADYWFLDAANIARFRVRHPEQYTAMAENYVEVLCWVFRRRMEAEWTGPPVQKSEPTPPETEQSQLMEVR